MDLSKRLRMNASLVTPGSRLADVGTDHGYIPVALVTEGRIPGAIAMDVNRGPLERAREHITDAELTDRIEIRLSDGLEQLRPGEADSVLIAGMGGPLMIRILTEGRRVLEECKELILQPQSELALVRKFLERENYRIVQENMVEEDGKFYTALRAEHGDMDWGQEVFYRYGKLLLLERQEVLKEYLLRRQKTCEQILNRLGKYGTVSEKNRIREKEIREELVWIQTGLAYYEM